MYFFLGKLLPLFVYPLGLGIVLVLLAALAAWRGRRGGAAGLALLAVAVLWLPSTPVVSAWLMYNLESRFPPTPVEGLAQADAIVVLGGAIADMGRQGDTLDMDAAYDRLYHALALYRAGRAPLIVVSGGAAEGRVPEAEVMGRLLREHGVPETAILREPNSRTTRENGVNTRELLRAQGLSRVILVTSAFHMERALGVFRRLGMDVTPSATDHRVDLRPPEFPVLDWLPSAQALGISTAAIHEFIGAEAYRHEGWID